MEGDVAKPPELSHFLRQQELRCSSSMIRTRRRAWQRKAAVRRSILGLHGQVDILTGTLGKALGGAAGATFGSRPARN